MSTRSGFCQFAVHDRCTSTAAGDPCSCPCHQPQELPQDRLERAAQLLDRADGRVPLVVGPAVAHLLRVEAAMAAFLGADYDPEDRALAALANQILTNPTGPFDPTDRASSWP